MAKTLEQAISEIMRDIAVELAEEFDRNFERQAFFNEAWERRRSPGREGGALLIRTGGLRRSIRNRVRGMRVVFSSDHPAALIHNDGGEIVVTERMKRYFWARYMESTGSLGRRKDGSLRSDKRNTRISAMADFYKAMALKKVGSKIIIPRRRFIGASPEVEAAVTEIITRGLEEYFSTLDLTKPDNV